MLCPQGNTKPSVSLWFTTTMTTTAATTGHDSWLGVRWRRFALAATFLTRLPLPIAGTVTPVDLRASMGWYPAIGAGLGAAAWGAYALATTVLPATVAAALIVILLQVANGALHLDGFMDTCDGLGSGKPRERMLEIMKDSRVGAMGVFGAIAAILLKVTALAALAPSEAVIPLVIGWSVARLLPLLNVTLFPYARATGTGGIFTEAKAPHAMAFALLCALAVAYGVGHWPGVLLAAAVVGGVLLVQLSIARKLGGLTGDVYGLGVELAEVAALVIWLGFS